jgi:hypothetical protein
MFGEVPTPTWLQPRFRLSEGGFSHTGFDPIDEQGQRTYEPTGSVDSTNSYLKPRLFSVG